jgi:hypothetical protein
MSNGKRMTEIDRRGFFSQCGDGLAGVAIADLLGSKATAEAPFNFTPRAKQVLQIFCPGGASHMDLWEHKPKLEVHDGKDPPGEAGFSSFQGKNGPLMRSPWPFKPAGKSGKMISTLLPNIARHVDDVAFIHSMTSKSNTHGPGNIYMKSCFVREGCPSAGAWASYALGSLNRNLPTYVAITDVRGEPPNGKANWSNGFLPAQHQGVEISAQSPPRNLARPVGVDPATDEAVREFLLKANEKHAERHPGDDELRARIKSHELAARLQLTAPEVSDLSREPSSVLARYGTGDANPLKAAYARNCLLARRLLERGVRYVDLYCASRASAIDGLLNWDAHRTLKADYERHAPIFDGPTAALLDDLKRLGMLKDVLVLWTTEFGRMPTRQAETQGRDHNPDGFTVWMMGAGVKPGVSYGATDDLGRRAAVDVSTPYDFYATVLHLLGLDHEKVTYYHNGANRRLTDVHGSVLKKVVV